MQDFSNELQLPEFKIINKDVKDGVVHYYLESANLVKPICPSCGKPFIGNGTPERLVRDMDLYGKPVALHILEHRFYCKDCRESCSETFDSVQPRARITNRLRNYIEEHCFTESISSLSQKYGVSVKTVSQIFNVASAKKESTWIYYTPATLGLFLIRLNGKMRLLCLDIDNSGIIDLLEDTDNTTIFKYLTDKLEADKIKTVIIDFDLVLLDTVYSVCQNARIIADRRHIIELFRIALEQELGRVRAKSKLSIVVKKTEDLSQREKDSIEELCQKNKGFETVYRAKEMIYRFLDCTDEKDARDQFANLGKIPAECVFFRKAFINIDNMATEVFAGYKHSYNLKCTQEAVKFARAIEKQGNGYSFNSIRARLLFAPPKKTATVKITKMVYKPKGSSGFNFTIPYGTGKDVLILGNYVSISDVMDMISAIME